MTLIECNGEGKIDHVAIRYNLTQQGWCPLCTCLADLARLEQSDAKLPPPVDVGTNNFLRQQLDERDAQNHALGFQCTDLFERLNEAQRETLDVTAERNVQRCLLIALTTAKNENEYRAAILQIADHVENWRRERVEAREVMT